MTKRTQTRPTDAELAILRVLWEEGPCTVRKVHDKVGQARGVGYTTVLKTMQIMDEKGLVMRDASQRSHVYRARFREEQTQKQLVTDLLDRAFSGSVRKLVMNALQSRKASKSELAEIRKMLDELEGGKK